MTRITRTSRAASPGLAAFSFALFVGACDRGQPASKPAPTPPGTQTTASATTTTPAKGEPNAVYTVRGQIVDLPDPKRPQSEFSVHHEAIDTFVDGGGKLVGMSAMTMGFPLAPGVALDGLKAGDMVEITFPVWWTKGLPDYHVTKVTPLPADTKLEFRAARPTPPAK